MLETKLILVEGMAGSGKSTTGQWLHDTLNKISVQSVFYHEFSKDHPIIDYTERNRDVWLSETISRWTSLANRIQTESRIYILDAAFFQCTIGEMLERGFSETEIVNHAFKILDIIKPLNPVLIYFYQNDIKSTLKKIYDSRSIKWQNKVNTFLDNTSFGAVNSTTGYELYLQFNIALRKITDDIFDKADIEKLAIENTEPNWPGIYKTIFSFLKV